MEIDEATGGVSCTFTTCCVSWQEMLEAVVQMRAKLDEQIRTSERCPFAPATGVQSAHANSLRHVV